MLSSKSLPCLLVAAVLSACGTIPAQTTPDGGPAAPDPAYWGLADKTCLRFEDGTASKLTVSIVLDSSTVGGTTTYKMLYRNNGFEQKTDWVAPTSEGLALYRRHLAADGLTPDKYFTYTPPPDLLFKGLKTTSMAHVTSTSAAISSSGGNSTAAMEFTLNVVSTDPLTANGAEVQAAQYSVVEAVTGGAITSYKLWFVPQVGIVKLDQLGTSTFWVLKTVEQNVAPDACIP